MKRLHKLFAVWLTSILCISGIAALGSKARCFDMLLINNYGSDITLEISGRSRKLIALPEVIFGDNNGESIAVTMMSVSNHDGEKHCTITLPKGKAYVIKDVKKTEKITWIGRWRSEAVDVKLAIKEDLPDVHFRARRSWSYSEANITLSNFIYSDLKDDLNNALDRVMRGETLDESDFVMFEKERDNFAAADEQIYSYAQPTDSADNLYDYLANDKEFDSVESQTKKDEIEIAQKLGWQKYKDLEDRFRSFTYDKKPEGGIRNLLVYYPDSLATAQEFVLFVIIHGTWAAGASDYYDEGDINFQHIMKFARDYADNKNVAAGVLSFAWSGANNFDDRVAAGKNLATVLTLLNNKFEPDSKLKVISIAHSHGCNVVNAASHYTQGVTFDHIINLATPVRDAIDKKVFKPTNYTKLTQFYSTSDLVAALGSIDPSRLGSIFTSDGSIRKYSQQEGRTTYNIRVQIDAADPGHSGIKAIVPYLTQIYDKIDKNYSYHHDFDLNINTLAYAKDSVFIAVRHQIDIKDILRAFQTSATSMPPVFLTKAQQELSFSKKQEHKFTSLYGTSIHDKNWLINRFARGVKEEVYPILPAMPSMGRLASYLW